MESTLRTRFAEILAEADRHKAEMKAKNEQMRQANLTHVLRHWVRHTLGDQYAKHVVGPSVTVEDITLVIRQDPESYGDRIYYLAGPCPNCGLPVEHAIQSIEDLARAVERVPMHFCPPPAEPVPPPEPVKATAATRLAEAIADLLAEHGHGS